MSHIKPATNADRWGTPDFIIEAINEAFPGGIKFDPCYDPLFPPFAERGLTIHEGAPEQFKKVSDSLSHNWRPRENGLAFVNPPYGRNETECWVTRIVDYASDGGEIIALLPASVGTSWFQHMLGACSCVAFFNKRLRFKSPDAKSKAPSFGSALFYFGDIAPSLRFLNSRLNDTAVVNTRIGRAAAFNAQMAPVKR